jgi:transposase-like protein
MQCPGCGSSRVYPSRLRNVVERLRQKMTERQPFRCHQCGWRRWRDVEFPVAQPDVVPADLRMPQPPHPLSQRDVDQLDDPA